MQATGLPQKEPAMQTIRRVLSEGFRFFFLGAGLLALLAGIVWLIWLTDLAFGTARFHLPLAMAAPHWHGHEMIFGYGSAALAGFLLTAVPNWTGTVGARPGFITGVALLWLSGRLAVWLSAGLPAWLVAVVDLALLPVLAAQVAGQLFHKPKPQNVVFLLFLTLFWLGNLLVHLDWTGPGTRAGDGMRMGVMALAAMIGVLGGRVTPAFTRNAMKRAGVQASAFPVETPRLDKLSLGIGVLLPLSVLLFAPAAGFLAIGLGLVQLLRLSGWRGRWCLGQPILLALHAGMALLALGLLVWGAAQLGRGDEVAALHVLGIGAVGGMTVAVMSRAILGHTGRPLVAPAPVALSYGLIALAALLRWLGGTLPADWYQPLILASGVIWVLAFALYLGAMAPAILAPRLPPAD